MAAFTPISQQQLESLLEPLALSECELGAAFEGGTVNSNYRVMLDQTLWVLTILEAIDSEHTQKTLELTLHLAKHGLKVPAPMAVHQRPFLTHFQRKPVVLVEYLEGQSTLTPTAQQVKAISHFCARMHALKNPTSLKNQMDASWRKQAISELRPHLNQEDALLIDAILEKECSSLFEHLPKGMIHYDLFKDNALFKGDELSGVIDFYYACEEAFVYDIAIVLLEWAWGHGGLDLGQTKALLKAYDALRPMESTEKEALCDCLEIMAAHFWMARSLTLLAHKKGEGQFEKDPNEYREKLLALQAQRSELAALFQEV